MLPSIDRGRVGGVAWRGWRTREWNKPTEKGNRADLESKQSWKGAGQQRSCRLCFKFLVTKESLLFFWSGQVSAVKELGNSFSCSLNSPSDNNSSHLPHWLSPFPSLLFLWLPKGWGVISLFFFGLISQPPLPVFVWMQRNISVAFLREVRGGCKIPQEEQHTAGKCCWFHFCQAANRC